MKKTISALYLLSGCNFFVFIFCTVTELVMYSAYECRILTGFREFYCFIKTEQRKNRSQSAQR